VVYVLVSVSERNPLFGAVYLWVLVALIVEH